MRAEILVGRERRRRWAADEKLDIVREGLLGGSGDEVVGFVPVEMPAAPSTGLNGALPGTDNFAAVATIEIGLAGGRCLKVSSDTRN